MNPEETALNLDDADPDDNKVGDVVSEKDDPIPDDLPKAPEGGFYGEDDVA